MKIKVNGGGRRITLMFPTCLLTGRLTLYIADKTARHYAPEAMANIPPGALQRLGTELRRMKKQNKRWTLVEVTSASGEEVHISL